jgi:hypothetical protein
MYKNGIFKRNLPTNLKTAKKHCYFAATPLFAWRHKSLSISRLFLMCFINVLFLYVGEDEHVLRKQEEIIQECFQMIPDSIRRLNTAVTDLHNSLDAEKDLEAIEEYQIALLSIAAAEPHLA